MNANDTIKQEKMKVKKVNGRWKLIVKIPEEINEITFNILHSKKDEFTSENKENDFPNIIKYWKKDKTLHAVISGGDMVIPFEFEKTN